MAEGHGKRVVYFHLRSPILRWKIRCRKLNFLLVFKIARPFFALSFQSSAHDRASENVLTLSRLRFRGLEGGRETWKRFENSSSFRNVDVLSFSRFITWREIFSLWCRVFRNKGSEIVREIRFRGCRVLKYYAGI